MTSRANNKWTVNELLSLQREYELLGMDIFQIALKHKRSPKAILYKLEDESIINNFNEARGYEKYFFEKKMTSVSCFKNEESDKSEDISDRVAYLENVVLDIKNTLEAISTKLSVESKSTKNFNF
jgi:hypothetical protein